MSLADHHLELLSPARNADIGIAAIQHGADAVYIGGPSFGARSQADNPVGDIARLVAHAHRFHARVFVTLNTILRDDELEPARRLAWQLYDAGVDALIVQDMGLLTLDMPPLQLHASTQTDIRTPEKARFLQDVGLSQIVLARELTLPQIAAIRAQTHCTLEFFIHGALCVAYSGQCYISHAHTGRSANRGDCSQACRLPYQVLDAQGRFVAHDKHVLSMKDNNQSENLEALVNAGIRSFKIEGRYKDLAYVKNITAHYRSLFDRLIDERPGWDRASSGRTRFGFTPDPLQNFNREFTDYFVQGRQQDIGAFDTPKNPGQPIGHVTQVGADWVELLTLDPRTALHNGDGLCYYSQQRDLIGLAINRAQRVADTPQGEPGSRWRVFPKDPMNALPDLRRGTELNRNRDMAWVRAMERSSSERHIGLWARLVETAQGLQLSLTDEDGFEGHAEAALAHTPPHDLDTSAASLRAGIDRFGGTDFALTGGQDGITLALEKPWFVPASQLNALRREALDALVRARAAAFHRLPRAEPLVPPVPYPDDTLSYLGNVFNQAARTFYARHGVRVIEAAYEAHGEKGEVSLMITKHCVRFSLSLCPKQAKGVVGVQGTVKAEPLTLVNGKERLTLRFDCKPCEMHVVGKIKPQVLKGQTAVTEAPITVHKRRPAARAPH